ncbi:DUF5805 domain-containing protein [Halapricum salinum]|uniref:Uncharacterized protein n=1 Tax=Halapricum salinum TaxID=1457250 RepID=A0A4D6HIV3_9EURY|nr:DUF5805 domain-containing protein [Halapricum salinum]QCC52637.1 hypothetical protein DV733_15985 [Halapricum salinum]
MVADGEVDTSRVTVKTYLPAYQKEQWQEHADQLGMSQSEYVKAMVQAGRRGFLDAPPDTAEAQPDDDTEGSGGDLRERVMAVLETDQHLDWDELLEALTDRIEDRLEDTLADLQDENRVRYSGRHGGYTLVEE